MIFLTDRNSLTWRLLYDISNRNYDYYRNSIVHIENNNMIRTVMKTLNNNSNDFIESTTDSSSSPQLIHNHLAKMLIKNRKKLLDKLIIRLMLNIDIYKFEKLRLKVFSYVGLKQRMILIITMILLHF
uniref:Uncharacterized protein LOC113797007 n=1 Tax=Dermatophagoides pteronyssinus TaxID=6956 RepID=A0A6P6YDY6_DERPT